MDRPRVSVVIPAWEAETTLPDTLASLAAQTEESWEAVVVDDGSTDGTVAVAESVAQEDPRVRLVRAQHGGVSAARNRGIAEARAEWLLFLDADDVLEPEALTGLLAATSPEVDLVMGGYVRVDPGGRRADGVLPRGSEDWFAVLANRCPVAIHACLARKEAVVHVGGFDTGLVLCEDWDLWQRVVRRGRGVALVPEVLAVYRVRENGASMDERGLLRDALQVVARGHRPDPRVPDPADRHRAGLPTVELTGRAYLLASWVAGQALGAGRDGAGLLELVGDRPFPGLDPAAVAEALGDGLAVHGHGRPWEEVEAGIDRFLAALERQSEATHLVDEARRRLEASVLERLPKRPATAGVTHLVTVNVDEAVPDVALPQEVQVLRVEVRNGEEVLGVVALPAVGRRVRGLVIADTIAAELGWRLLGHFFESTVYSGPADHDAVGWGTFLRELWGRPDWSEAAFYDPRTRDDRPASSAQLVDGWLHVEVSSDLPRVSRVRGEVPVAVAVGGRSIGAITVTTRRGLSPQQLRAAIAAECGAELLTAAVREGLLGSSHDGPLRARLREAAARADDGDGDEEVLWRHPHGAVTSPASRHATLPQGAVDLLRRSIARERQPLTRNEAGSAGVRYAPDRLWAVPRMVVTPPAPEADDSAQKAFTRHDFEALFAADADPWKYTTEYEHIKYRETLELLPAGPIDRAIELGCAGGHFTAMLAPRVGRLVAADISQIALEAARERCQEFSNVDYRQLDLGSDELPGLFDLVVCSEMLAYTADRRGFPAVAARLAAALRPGGHLLTAHANVVVDGESGPAFEWDVPFGAAFISRTFTRTPGLELVQELKTPLYRIQLYRRTTGRRPFPRLLRRTRPRVEERPLTARLEPEVAAHVRWTGKAAPAADADGPAGTDRLPILMYHRVSASGSEALSRYRVTPSALDEQLGYLRSAGFRGTTLEEWAEARRVNRPLPGRAVLLTFDDAYVDFQEEAWPILQRHGFPATLFVPTAHVGGSNVWDEVYGEKVPLLGWNDLQALHGAGVTIGAHGHTHRPLSALTPAEMAEEAARSRVELEDRLQAAVTAVAYPYGRHDSVVTHLHAACGFLHGVTTRSAFSSLKDPAMALPRVEVLGDDDVSTFIRRVSVTGDRRV
ncbi:glycosyltransferase [Geodermatophilus sp. SYSU D00705]